MCIRILFLVLFATLLRVFLQPFGEDPQILAGLVGLHASAADGATEEPELPLTKICGWSGACSTLMMPASFRDRRKDSLRSWSSLPSFVKSSVRP